MIADSDVATLNGDYWTTGYVNCTTPDNVAGRYNVSVNVVAGPTYGLGDVVSNLNTFDASGSLLHHYDLRLSEYL